MSDPTGTPGTPATDASTPATPPVSAPATTPATPSTPGTPAAPADGQKPAEASLLAGQPGGTKPAETPAVAAVEFNPKLPEGVDAKHPWVAGLVSVAKEHGVKPEATQKLIDSFFTQQQEQLKQAETSKASEITQWKTSVQSDKELGGDKLVANLTVARKAIEQFGSEELKALVEGPLGNHPEFVRFAYRVGKALAEDSVAGTTTGAAAKNEEQALYDDLYPTMKKEASQ